MLFYSVPEQNLHTIAMQIIMIIITTTTATTTIIIINYVIIFNVCHNMHYLSAGFSGSKPLPADQGHAPKMSKFRKRSQLELKYVPSQNTKC